MKQLCAATHESGSGTKRTFPSDVVRSAIGCKAEVEPFRFDPQRTCNEPVFLAGKPAIRVYSCQLGGSSIPV